MKKILILAVAAVMALSLAACANGGADSSQPDMTLQEQMSAILEGVELPNVQNIEITDENFEMYFFTPPVEGAEALVSEPIIGSIAHSVGLVRVKDAADAEGVAASIRENMDPRKWICVEAEKTEVIAHGDTVLMVMSTEDAATAIAANFDALYK